MEKPQPQRASTQSQYKLVVKRIQEIPDLAEVCEFCSRFGKVLKIDTGKDEPLRLQPYDKIPREITQDPLFEDPEVICLITLASKLTSKAILKAPKTYFGAKRPLFQLVSYNPSKIPGQAHEKRIILKQVPLDMDLTKLKSNLERLCGKLDVFYVFRSDSEINVARRHLTCSALFRESTGVKALVRAGSFLASNGKPIVVRKYVHDIKPTNYHKKKDTYPEIDGLQNDFPVSICPSDSFKKQPEGRGPQELEADVEKMVKPHHLSGAKNVIRKNLKSKFSHEVRRQTFMEDKCSLAYFHEPKPTSKYYHSLRGLSHRVPSSLLLPPDGSCFRLTALLPNTRKE